MDKRATMDQLKHELRQLETETFEIEDVGDLDVDAADWCSSSCSCSSTCSCSSSSTGSCSCSTSDWAS